MVKKTIMIPPSSPLQLLVFLENLSWRSRWTFQNNMNNMGIFLGGRGCFRDTISVPLLLCGISAWFSKPSISSLYPMHKFQCSPFYVCSFWIFFKCFPSIWNVFSFFPAGTPVHQQKQWFRETFDHLLSICDSSEASEAGIHLVSGWI